MDNDIQTKLRVLHSAYADKLPHKLQEIQTDWQYLRDHWESPRLENFHREIHSLCGSAAIYGYKTLSESARELEMYLKSLIDDRLDYTPDIRQSIEAFISKLQIVI